MSVDSLQQERIVGIARRNLGFDPVRSALAAEDAGLAPIKLNMVVMRGVNDDEVEAMARLTVDHAWHVRFIELMPVGDLRELEWKHVVASDEILARLNAIAALTPAEGPARGNGPAAYYQWPGAKGTIGVITPMTHTYCASCNRVRLTADGRLRTCLFGNHEVDLRTPLRAGEPLEAHFRQALADKPKEHELLQMKIGGLRALSQVGG
jgi:cyclic pyranopterin phosphate synthase